TAEQGSHRHHDAKAYALGPTELLNDLGHRTPGHSNAEQPHISHQDHAAKHGDACQMRAHNHRINERRLTNIRQEPDALDRFSNRHKNPPYTNAINKPAATTDTQSASETAPTNLLTPGDASARTTCRCTV